MVTFFVCLVVLIVGYIFYSRFTEKIFVIDENRETPAIACPDGVDKVPMKKWKAFLIELLNIAGTGPIFGAISGALFGPIVFVWIVIGCLLGGGVHDFMCGMISSRHNGGALVKISGKYLGKVFQIIMRIFSIVLLILVTAVFVVSPASLLVNLTSGNVASWVWIIIILAYYFLATLLPIDKVIGKAYPVFGIILIGMAIAVIIGCFINFQTNPLLELIGNLKDYSALNGDLPAWPFMLTTVACGAISGFHATQAPMVANCIKSEKEGRQVFYGAMVAEGIIALIWAAAAMAFYKIDTVEGWNMLKAVGGSSTAVHEICSTLLGPVGSVLAIVGVVICPITSGDTALRSCRLILAETFNLDQKPIKNRIILTVPLFVAVALISLWNFLSPDNFNVLWRWFAWSNQTLATLALWIATAYMIKENKNGYASLITAIPASIMSAVVITYLLGEPNISFGKFIPLSIAYIIGAICGFILFVLYVISLFKKYHKAR